MQTIGDYLRAERESRNLSFSELEEKTKIKKEFLKAMEAQKWEALPEYPVVLGFVKNIARNIESNESKAVALFRRDYPPQKRIDLNPKPDLPKEFRWGPKLTFFLGVFIVISVMAGYLIFQYRNFTSPPKLEVFEPTQGQIVKKRELKVLGKTDTGAVVKVNNQPVLLSKEGTFETELDIYEGTKEIEVTAVSRSGKEAKRTISIVPALEQ